MWITADWGVIEEDPTVPGSTRVITGCIWPHIPRWFGMMIGISNRPAAAFEDLRNKVAAGFRILATQNLNMMEVQHKIASNASEQKRLEDHGDRKAD